MKSSTRLSYSLAQSEESTIRFPSTFAEHLTSRCPSIGIDTVPAESRRILSALEFPAPVDGV